MGKLKDVVKDIPTGDYPNKEYAKEVKISTGVPTILRFLEGDDSFLTYYISWIFCDDEVIRPFIVENDKEGPSILARMFGDRNNFYKGGYLESLKGQFGKVFTYQTKDPELWKIMTEYWNPAYDGAGSCRPQKEFIFNVIHRNLELIEDKQVSWCDVEKHTKILRLRQKALEAFSAVSDNDGNTKDYDINYTKSGKGVNTINSMMKAGPNVPFVKIGFLSEEEQNYTRYNLPEIIKLVSAYYCLKHIPSKIKRMDAAMGTNYYAEFEKQKEIENAAWEQKKGQNAEVNNPSNMDSSRIPLKGPIQTVICDYCKELIPANSAECPKCKTKLQEACPTCNNLFSIKLKVCPFCGEKFQ